MPVIQNKNTSKYFRAFTLVELLLAISILAILIGVSMSVLNPRGIRAKARDSQRVSDLEKIRSALELYYADNRAYPVAASYVFTSNAGLSSALSTYISTLPSNASGESGTLCSGTVAWTGFGYASNGSTYSLVTNVENLSSSNGVNGACPTTLPTACGTPATTYCYGTRSP